MRSRLDFFAAEIIMYSLSEKKVLLCKSDVSVIKAYANHLKQQVNPHLSAGKIKNTVILRHIAQSLGYNNYEELKRYCSSIILFTDVYLYLSNIVENVLVQLLNPANLEQKKQVALLSEYVDSTFEYQDISDYLFDFEPPCPMPWYTLLVPHSCGQYEVILFSSYVQLALKLSQFHELKAITSPSFYDNSLAEKAIKIKSAIDSNYPVYSYIKNLLPPGSLFVVDEKEKVIDHDYVNFCDLPPGFGLEAFYLRQLGFLYPSSFLYQPSISKSNVLHLDCINPGFESETRFPRNPLLNEIFEKNMSGVVACEALFRNPGRRTQMDVKLSYKENCDASLKNLFNRLTTETSI